MHTDIAPSAPGAILLLLAALGAIGLCALASVHSWLTGKTLRLRWTVSGAVLVAVLYAGTLVTLSLASRERVLGRGEEKHICEIDCHLAYSVSGMRNATTPQGKLTVVDVRVRFDGSTTSPGRGNGPLTPNRRRVELLDENGRVYPLSRSALAALGAAPTLSDPLRPGESLTVPLAFDVPPSARRLRLLVAGDTWETWLLVGHENSPLHGKTYLAIPEPAAS